MAHREDDRLDLNALLHPAQAFCHPQEVVDDPDLTLNEKRSILASWASDACAVDSQPALRRARDGQTVPFDDVIEALRELDRQAQAVPMPRRNYEKALRRERIFGRFRRGGGGSHESGTPLQ
jgi:hypothetical protein